MDENSRVDASAGKLTVAENSVLENPTSDTTVANSDGGGGRGGPGTEASGTESNVVRSRQSSRTPFTNLSQVDADLALARTLQEQERAYVMLRMNGDRSEYGSYYRDDDDDDFGDLHDHEYDEFDDDEDEDEDEEEDGDDVDNDDEDAFDVHAHADADSGESVVPRIEVDPTAFPDDEAYARSLQDVEERETMARLLAMAAMTEHNLLFAGDVFDIEDHVGNSQDTWEEVDPDELSYEELLALGEVVGTESRGLAADTIASLPSIKYKSKDT